MTVVGRRTGCPILRTRCSGCLAECRLQRVAELLRWRIAVDHVVKTVAVRSFSSPVPRDGNHTPGSGGGRGGLATEDLPLAGGGAPRRGRGPRGGGLRPPRRPARPPPGPAGGGGWAGRAGHRGAAPRAAGGGAAA